MISFSHNSLLTDKYLQLDLNPVCLSPSSHGLVHSGFWSAVPVCFCLLEEPQGSQSRLQPSVHTLYTLKNLLLIMHSDEPQI